MFVKVVTIHLEDQRCAFSVYSIENFGAKLLCTHDQTSARDSLNIFQYSPLLRFVTIRRTIALYRIVRRRHASECPVDVVGVAFVVTC